MAKRTKQQAKAAASAAVASPPLPINPSANPSKRSKTTSQEQQVVSEPSPIEDASTVTTKQQLSLLKQRFNALHELKFTEAETQLAAVLAQAQEQSAVHQRHITALEDAHAAEIARLRQAFDAERALLEHKLAAECEPTTKQTTTVLLSHDAERAIALLDGFKALTGMHVNMEDEGKGTCTILNPESKQGVRFLVEFLENDEEEVIRLSPGANCKKLLPKSMLGPHVLPRKQVPAFICRVQSHLFNI